MRKILVLGLLVSLLGSCAFGEKDTDFASLYKSYIATEMGRLDKMSELVGYKRHESIEGAMKAALQVPVLMSGSFSSDYNIKVNNTDMSAILENMNMQFESPINSGAISAKKIGLTSITGDLYLLMENFTHAGLFPPEAQAVFAKYNNKWLSYTQADVDSKLSGASLDEIALSNTAKNLSKMGIKDIEGYLTEYPIWKSTADLGMSGSLHRFAVELDQEAVVNLVKKATLDITGSGLTSESETEFRASLSGFAFSGEIAFNPDDANVMDMNLGIAESGSLIGNVRFSTSIPKTELRFTSVEDATDVVFSLQSEESRDDMKLVLSQSGTELAQVVGYMLHDGEDLRELSLEATAQGVSLTLKHAIKADGTFDGRLTLPVGIVNWTGKQDGKRLEALSLRGTTPVGSIDMNLVPAGDILRGPLTVKNGNQEILSMDIGLKVDDGVFGIDLAVKNPEGGDPTLHASLDITSKTKKYDDPILAPTPSEPLQHMIDDLEKIAPPTDDALTGDTSLESISGDSDYVKRSRDAARIAMLKNLANGVGAYYSDREAYPLSDKGCMTENVLNASYIEEKMSDPVNDYDDGCGSNSMFGYAVGTSSYGSPQFIITSIFESENGGNFADEAKIKDILRDGVFDATERAYLDTQGTVRKGNGKVYVLYK